MFLMCYAKSKASTVPLAKVLTGEILQQVFTNIKRQEKSLISNALNKQNQQMLFF